MPWTISTNGNHVTVYADDDGLDQIITLARIAQDEGVSKVVDETGSSVTFVRDPEWTPR